MDVVTCKDNPRRVYCLICSFGLWQCFHSSFERIELELFVPREESEVLQLSVIQSPEANSVGIRAQEYHRVKSAILGLKLHHFFHFFLFIIVV